MNLLKSYNEHKNLFFLGSLLLNITLIVGLLYLYFNPKECPECNCEENQAISMNSANECVKKEETSQEDPFYVEIKGAVKSPGVYKVNKDNIINDIVTMADGFNKDAYTRNINLSRRVTSELVVYIYSNEEIEELKNVLTEEEQEDIVNPCEAPTYDITDCLEKGKSEIEATHENEEAITKDSFDENNDVVVSNSLININTASLEELMTINYIGESKAKAIIEYRNTNGKFKSLEELKNVHGIGDILFEKIKDSITI